MEITCCTHRARTLLYEHVDVCDTCVCPYLTTQILSEFKSMIHKRSVQNGSIDKDSYLRPRTLKFIFFLKDRKLPNSTSRLNILNSNHANVHKLHPPNPHSSHHNRHNRHFHPGIESHHHRNNGSVYKLTMREGLR